ncbi:sensor histidine kinase [Candidatus Galacturonibacter soehngenii]|uniref:histidine kinase n=2 Tax=Candidatus Galacturonatibacter soehngenii TaxID=2307010 RepID=A0A7V7QMW7_9FIRM|nr:HAMP domain-containing sensor histidine kinase [Candidatus Galacturonibacter soehngenii]KAB1439845.1 HAMP domain-containing histidine kinase [Candidatus Galacturonibacter soehngenii]
MGRIKKREISLSLFYLKYFGYVFLSVILIALLVFITLGLLFSSNTIYRADYAQEQANLAYETILNSEVVTKDLIPELCQYVVFDQDGNRIDGSIIKERGIEHAWKAVEGSKSDIYGNYYKVIKRKNEYCVLRYQIVPQYKSAFLRQYVLPPQTAIFIITILLILLSLICVAIRFGHVLNKKLNPLILATQKIQNQELDFAIQLGNIKELNQVLASMDNMRNELKHSLESQWKMEQLKKEQMSALAHDLKTPLTLILGNTDLLYDTNPSTEQLECLDYIKTNTRKIQDYVQLLMEVTKSNDGMQAKFNKIAIAEFLQNVKRQANGLCMVKHIQLVWNECYQSKWIQVDDSLLERAINNVVANAVEHTLQDGVITIEIEEEKGYLIFSICDNGEGFTQEALKHATEQFYMGDRSRNVKSHYGMGLYIADSVAKQHGGYLILENDADSHGAKVIFHIPIG